jgi:hypothetical protein
MIRPSIRSPLNSSPWSLFLGFLLSTPVPQENLPLFYFPGAFFMRFTRGDQVAFETEGRPPILRRTRFPAPSRFAG